MVETHELFTPDECAQVAATVDDLRAYWERNSPTCRLHVLGAASYVLCNGGAKAGPPYLDRARRLTPILRARFGWMYDRLLAKLAAVLGAPAALAEGLCPPGFHHYRWDPQLHLVRCSLHLDLQWKSHDFARYGEPDYQHPLSFTIAFRVPAKGCGMNIWSATKRADIVEANAVYAPYQLGELNLHSGLFFHQIAPMELAPDESRLTLQGHAIRCDGTWQCYW